MDTYIAIAFLVSVAIAVGTSVVLWQRDEEPSDALLFGALAMALSWGVGAILGGVIVAIGHLLS